MHDVSDADPLATYSYVASEARHRKIAFICAREPRSKTWLGPELKKLFGGIYIANELFTQESGEEVLSAGEADAVAYGQLFIANPDLPRRFLESSPLNLPDSSTFYGKGPHGYTDYPSLNPDNDGTELALEKGRDNDHSKSLSAEKEIDRLSCL